MIISQDCNNSSNNPGKIQLSIEFLSGIGVSVTFVILSLIAIIGCCYCKAKRSKKQQDCSPSEQVPLNNNQNETEV